MLYLANQNGVIFFMYVIIAFALAIVKRDGRFKGERVLKQRLGPFKNCPLEIRQKKAKST